MRSLIFCFLLSFSLPTLASEILLLEGKFQNRNIYVQNGFDSGIGFCVYEVRINGRVTTDEVNSSAFEIDFSSYQTGKIILRKYGVDF